ncbi:replication-associated protein [Spinybacked orbweaver circular virus 1]|uniref:ATP-dependent helicase Rep n=1 Tax=Spinybacked orbweaver circular virus 1 TaxID=2293305 RepID=A0A346BPA0_9VIRU|nr:replication-associated protein [Spinybacked orbweaver circular virus 1]AXL65897.1 replication-associated protein [Spinybacked orbweaver circular virus 1]
MSRCHGWTFTVFALEPEPVFEPNLHEYLIFGRETCPTTGRSHLQGYIYFKERRRLPYLKKWIPGAHFEAAKGNPEQNQKYCSKDGDFKEYGRLPRSKSGGGAFKDVLLKAESGNIADIKEEYPGLFIRYKTNILSSVKFRVEELKSSCGVWICGPPRCGKDYAVRKLNSVYVKPLNKWWDGYNNENFVLLSDVEPPHCSWLGFFLKIWTDRYAFVAEIKGGSVKIRPKKIFVTSNFTLEECFSGKVLEALRTRFNVYNEFDGSFFARQVDSIKTAVYDKLLSLEDGLVQEKENVSPSVSKAEEILSSSEEFENVQKPSKKKKRLSKTNSAQ